MDDDDRDQGGSRATPDSAAPGDAADQPAVDDEVGLVVRAVPVVLLVVAACAVVAIGAGGAGLLAPPIAPAAGWRLAIRVIGAVAVCTGAARLVMQRRQASYEGRGRDPTVAALLGAATIMIVLALLSLLAPAATAPQEGPPAQFAAAQADESQPPDEQAPPRATGAKRAPGIPGGFGLGLSGGRERPVGRAQESVGQERDLSAAIGVFQWIGRILLPLLLVALVVGVWIITGRLGSARETVEPGPPVAPESAEAGLEASLEALGHAGSDARSGITAAYRALLAALAAAGAPREPQEAPYEHLNRALGPLGVRPEPMLRLTELYVIAQFSERPVTERERDSAMRALEAALASLRSRIAAAARHPARQAAVP